MDKFKKAIIDKHLVFEEKRWLGFAVDVYRCVFCDAIIIDDKLCIDEDPQDYIEHRDGCVVEECWRD